MKNINKIFLVLAMSAGIIATSCSEDDVTGESVVDYKKPTVTLTTINSTNEFIVKKSEIDAENGNAITVTATIPEPVMADIYIPLVQTSGTADSSDFSAGTIYIKSGNTSGSANVIIFQECESGIEVDQTLTISHAETITNAKVATFNLKVSIVNDWVNDIIAFDFNYTGSTTWDGGPLGDVPVDFCEVKIQYGLAELDHTILGYITTSAGCKVSGEFGGLTDGLDDGTYLLFGKITNPLIHLNLTDVMPVTINYSQCGFPETSGSWVNKDINLSTADGIVYFGEIKITDGYNYVVTPN